MLISDVQARHRRLGDPTEVCCAPEGRERLRAAPEGEGSTAEWLGQALEVRPTSRVPTLVWSADRILSAMTAERACVMVWDGLRPDMVSRALTPHLWGLAE